MIKLNQLVILMCALFGGIGLAVKIVNNGNGNNRESRKLFGGYRITPRFCKPTRNPSPTTSASEQQQRINGPSICMFNHECSQRNGQVVGACMDGFLFGACCQLPSGSIGDLTSSDSDIVAGTPDNTLPISDGSSSNAAIPKPDDNDKNVDLTSSGMSQITQSLLTVLPTAQDNAVVQISDDASTHFTTAGVTHPAEADTVVLNNKFDNYISPNDFTTRHPIMQDRKTTLRITDDDSINAITYRPNANTVDSDSGMLPISISNAPSLYTPAPPMYQRPIFRPKPQKPSDADKYVLVPTIMHDSKPNKTQEVESIVNILQMLNESSTKNPYYGIVSTSKKPSSTTPYIYPSTIITKRPSSYTSTLITTSKKPPSTSYVFSTTLKPRRTTTPVWTTTRTTTKRRPTTPKRKTTKRPTTNYQQSTYAQKPSSSSYLASTTTKKPLSTSYVYNSEPTRRPSPVINTHVAGPSFTVSSSPATIAQYPNYGQTSAAAPTLIVLGDTSITDAAIDDNLDDLVTTRPPRPSRPTYHPLVSPDSSYYPSSSRPTTQHQPPRKPINSVTINNHVTQNIYSTSERPHPTVLITPKPSISTSLLPSTVAAAAAIDASDTIEVGTSANDLINFPPVRNPNLNMSVVSQQQGTDQDITTPSFIEDEALDEKMESFVNKIIQGLQEPFEGLKDVVYNKNKTSASGNLIGGGSTTTTKKPVKKQGSTTKRPPAVRPSSNRPGSGVTVKTTTRRPVTKKPTVSQSTKRPTSTKKPISVTTKRTKTTRKPTTAATTTTTESFIEEDNNGGGPVDSEEYRTKCGIRPLVKSGRIVGGKGATFGEFPWQVLVRESTWLGLFTKNKCGGVLISNKYVMTAAHCQPGFLASLVAVFGEFDISGDLESKRPLSRNVKRVIVHRQYDAATFENDLALLELEAPIQFDEHIVPICLPRDGEEFTGRMATVTGWGRLKYGGGVPSVLQEVQVPIMENHVCQEMFQTAGHLKVILESFLCAGYANGQKDSCEGDSGGPLVLQRPDGRYQLAGTVSHGIKCAAPYLPGVYMRTTFYKPWIQSITGLD